MLRQSKAAAKVFSQFGGEYAASVIIYARMPPALFAACCSILRYPFRDMPKRIRRSAS